MRPQVCGGIVFACLRLNSHFVPRSRGMGGVANGSNPFWLGDKVSRTRPALFRGRHFKGCHYGSVCAVVPAIFGDGPVYRDASPFQLIK